MSPAPDYRHKTHRWLPRLTPHKDEILSTRRATLSIHGQKEEPLKLTELIFQGDQLRRLHPNESLVDVPKEHGVYSLELKQHLLDKMTTKQNKNKEPKEVARGENNEADSSTGLSSRLDKVKITGDAEDIVNGNTGTRTDDNGNRQPRQPKNNIKEKTIVVKDKTTSKKNIEVRKYIVKRLTHLTILLEKSKKNALQR